MQRRGDQQAAPPKPTPVGEHDGRQFACVADEFGHRPLVDRDPRRRQPQTVIVVEAGRAVGEQHDVIAPSPQQQRGMHGLLAARQHRQRLIPNLPAVAERAMEHRPAPQLGKPRQRRRAVIHAGGQQHPSRPLPVAVAEFQLEDVGHALACHHLARCAVARWDMRPTRRARPRTARPAIGRHGPAGRRYRVRPDCSGHRRRPAACAAGPDRAPGRRSGRPHHRPRPCSPKRCPCPKLARHPSNCQAHLPCRQTIPRTASINASGGGCGNCACSAA